MAEVYNLSRVRRRQPAKPIDLPSSLHVFADTFGIGLPNSFSQFYLIRSRRGTQVFIKEGPLSVNLSAALKTYPSGFKAARQWIAAIADRQGWEIHETRQRL